MMTIVKPVRKIKFVEGFEQTGIYVNGEIDDDTAHEFCTELQAVEASGQTVVIVYIHSIGGDMYSALKMVDAIAASSVRVITVATGHAFSAATLLFSCGTQRYVTPNATIMVHDVQVESLEGRLQDVKTEHAEMERLSTILWDTISSNIGQEKGYMRKHYDSNKDSYLSAQDALDIGLATHSGCPTMEVKVNVEYTIHDRSPVTLLTKEHATKRTRHVL